MTALQADLAELAALSRTAPFDAIVVGGGSSGLTVARILLEALCGGCPTPIGRVEVSAQAINRLLEDGPICHARWRRSVDDNRRLSSERRQLGNPRREAIIGVMDKQQSLGRGFGASRGAHAAGRSPQFLECGDLSIDRRLLGVDLGLRDFGAQLLVGKTLLRQTRHREDGEESGSAQRSASETANFTRHVAPDTTYCLACHEGATSASGRTSIAEDRGRTFRA